MQHLLSELNHELTATKKLLDRIPEQELGWKPHVKAMSLGQLALHVASIPGRIAGFAVDGATPVDVLIEHPEARSKNEILEAFKQETAKAQEILEHEATEWETNEWNLKKGEDIVLTLPRSLLARLLMFNHWYHHRGQLATYLRMLDVQVPSIYGPSADENPF